MATRLKGRPIAEGRRPACAIHEDGRVTFFGFRKTAEGVYARPRYRCDAPDGSTHYFTDSAQSRTHVHPGRVRGIASVNKQRRHDLAKIRAAWGDYETEAPQTEPQEEEALEIIGVEGLLA